jgi:hypothetical protein
MKWFDCEAMVTSVIRLLIDCDWINDKLFLSIMLTYRRARELYREVWKISSQAFTWGLLPAICSLRLKQYIDKPISAKSVWTAFKAMISEKNIKNFPSLHDFNHIEYRLYEVFLTHRWDFYANHSQEEIDDPALAAWFINALKENLLSRFSIAIELHHPPAAALKVFRAHQWNTVFDKIIKDDDSIRDLIWDYRDKGFTINEVYDILKKIPIIHQNMAHITEPATRKKWESWILSETKFHSALQTMKKQTGYQSE